MITFDQLIALYRHTAFSPDGAEGLLTLRDGSVLETIRLIEADDQTSRDAGIIVVAGQAESALGSTVRIDVMPPRTGLGLLALNLDALLSNPQFRMEEPQRYYLIQDRVAYNDAAGRHVLAGYREALRLVRTLSMAAIHSGKHEGELLFVGPGRLTVPVEFRSIDVRSLNSRTVDEFEHFLAQKVHVDQKADIVSGAVIEMCRGVPAIERFRRILLNLAELLETVQERYRLFTSEFSYERIRGDAERAIEDYTIRIHKAFHDVQNQALGIPIASVVIATQLEEVVECGPGLWSNFAVSMGATVFALLLGLAVANQFATLSNIAADLGRQRRRLEQQYAAVASDFAPLYGKLDARIKLNRLSLSAIVLCCAVGLMFTWAIYGRLTAVTVASCL